MKTPLQRTRDALIVVKERFQRDAWNERGREVIKPGAAFGDAVNDTELAMDKALGQAIFQTCTGRDMSDLGRISIEGMPDQRLDGKGHLWLTADPLDGSLNYRMTTYGIGLPISACVTVLDRHDDATFGNVVAAGVVDLRTSIILCAERTDGPYRPVGVGLRTIDETVLDLGSQIVIGEMYYPENREKLCRMFAGEKGWLRNPGSAAYEMMLVAAGIAAAYVCDRQKQHELGMGYALVKAAGGVALDWDGKDLGRRVYDFKTQTPVILAANQGIADAILERIHNKH